MVTAEVDLLHGDAIDDRQPVRLGEFVEMVDDGGAVRKGGRAGGKSNPGQCRKITMRVEVQVLVPTVPGFGESLLPLQYLRGDAGLDQRVGGGEPGGAAPTQRGCKSSRRGANRRGAVANRRPGRCWKARRPCRRRHCTVMTGW